MTERRPATDRLRVVLQEIALNRQRSEELILHSQHLIWHAREAIAESQRRRAAHAAQRAADRDATAENQSQS